MTKKEHEAETAPSHVDWQIKQPDFLISLPQGSSEALLTVEVDHSSKYGDANRTGLVGSMEEQKEDS
jgi:hypothetical protein